MGALQVLGTAASNNREFQEAALDAVPELMDRVLASAGADDPDLASKALFAASAMVRNSPTARLKFVASGGAAVLRGVLAGDAREGQAAARAKAKGVGLLADALRAAGEAGGGGEAAVLRELAQPGLFEAAVGLAGDAGGGWAVRTRALETVQLMLETDPRGLGPAALAGELPAALADFRRAAAEDEDGWLRDDLEPALRGIAAALARAGAPREEL